MPAVERLGADELRTLVRTYRRILQHQRGHLDRLNVFPVPDGDTGTNLLRTADAVVDALPDGADLPATCRVVAEAALLGARGNSGVILTQVLRGLTGVLAEAGEATGPDVVAAGLVAAAAAARTAVLEPVEGTMLTVADAAGAAAEAAAQRGAALVGVLEAAQDAATAAVARTTSQLPVLAEAGVVDAGGAGLALLLDAALVAVDGRRLHLPDQADGPAPTQTPALTGPRYEVTYLLEGTADRVDVLPARLGRLGDSVAVSGRGGRWSCHVHTDAPDDAVAAGAEVGTPSRVEVVDLTAQVAARCAGAD